MFAASPEVAAPQQGSEQLIRERFAAGDLTGVATLGLRAYGDELLGFLSGLLQSRQLAEEALSVFLEDMWKGLPQFSWQCSFRTWAYTLARHSALRCLRDGRKFTRGRVPASQASWLSALAVETRSRTATYLRPESQQKLTAIRRELSEDDNLLLVLRADRQLSWLEIARILDSNSAPTASELQESSAKLRKRYQRLKERVRELGKQAGILSDDHE